MKIKDHIEGIQVVMRTATLEDAEYTYEIRQDKEKTRFVHALDGGIEKQREWIQSQINSKDSYFFVMSDKEGKLFGTYAIYDINLAEKKAQIGRALLDGTPTQNMEAIYLIHEFAFKRLNLEMLCSDVFENNLAAIGVNKRVGGVIVDKGYDEEFQQNNYVFEILKENYIRESEKLKMLINRFKNR